MKFQNVSFVQNDKVLCFVWVLVGLFVSASADGLASESTEEKFSGLLSELEDMGFHYSRWLQERPVEAGLVTPEQKLAYWSESEVMHDNSRIFCDSELQFHLASSLELLPATIPKIVPLLDPSDRIAQRLQQILDSNPLWPESWTNPLQNYCAAMDGMESLSGAPRFSSSMNSEEIRALTNSPDPETALSSIRELMKRGEDQLSWFNYAWGQCLESDICFVEIAVSIVLNSKHRKLETLDELVLLEDSAIWRCIARFLSTDSGAAIFQITEKLRSADWSLRASYVAMFEESILHSDLLLPKDWANECKDLIFDTYLSSQVKRTIIETASWSGERDREILSELLGSADEDLVRASLNIIGSKKLSGFNTALEKFKTRSDFHIFHGDYILVQISRGLFSKAEYVAAIRGLFQHQAKTTASPLLLGYALLSKFGEFNEEIKPLLQGSLSKEDSITLRGNVFYGRLLDYPPFDFNSSEDTIIEALKEVGASGMGSQFCLRAIESFGREPDLRRFLQDLETGNVSVFRVKQALSNRAKFASLLPANSAAKKNFYALAIHAVLLNCSQMKSRVLSEGNAWSVRLLLHCARLCGQRLPLQGEHLIRHPDNRSRIIEFLVHSSDSRSILLLEALDFTGLAGENPTPRLFKKLNKQVRDLHTSVEWEQAIVLLEEGRNPGYFGMFFNKDKKRGVYFSGGIEKKTKFSSLSIAEIRSIVREFEQRGVWDLPAFNTPSSHLPGFELLFLMKGKIGRRVYMVAPNSLPGSRWHLAYLRMQSMQGIADKR